jgi:hypothetical protein
MGDRKEKGEGEREREPLSLCPLTTAKSSLLTYTIIVCITYKD